MFPLKAKHQQRVGYPVEVLHLAEEKSGPFLSVAGRCVSGCVRRELIGLLVK